MDSAKKSTLFPDCVSALKAVRELGARIGLVTNTSEEAVRLVFEKHGIERFFDVIVTRDCVKRLKPDPEGILVAVKKLSVKRFFMVGDLALDVLAAKNAKGVAILLRRERENSNLQNGFESLPEILREVQAPGPAQRLFPID